MDRWGAVHALGTGRKRDCGGGAACAERQRLLGHQGRGQIGRKKQGSAGRRPRGLGAWRVVAEFGDDGRPATQGQAEGTKASEEEYHRRPDPSMGSSLRPPPTLATRGSFLK